MKLFVAATALAVLATPVIAADIAGSKDHPLVGRYQGSSITFYEQAAFDDQQLPNRPLSTTSSALDGGNALSVQGKVFRIRYDAPPERSNLEIMTNYEASLKANGFQTVFSCANKDCLSGDDGYYKFGIAIGDNAVNYRYQGELRYTLAELARPEGDVYAAIAVAGKTGAIVHVTVVEAKPMEGDKIAFVSASQMATAIQGGGHVALYGILFDFDKADIKPESKPTLDEIAKFLKSHPNVNIVVAGHTDSQGGYDYNIDLSRRRAQAVIAALSGSYGIPATRLTAFGAGMAAPVASNDDDVGRAKNRRVELVKR